MINLIITSSKNSVVSNDGKLPWLIPEIFQDIKDTTKDSFVVLGTSTFEYMGSRCFPLARRTFVLSRRVKTPRIKDVSYISSPFKIPQKGRTDIYVLGGINTFKTFLPFVNSKIILYFLEENFKGEKYSILRDARKYLQNFTSKIIFTQNYKEMIKNKNIRVVKNEFNFNVKNK